MVEEEKVKEAFSKIKEDILTLGAEITELRTDLQNLSTENRLLADILGELVAKIPHPAQETQSPTPHPQTPTQAETPTHHQPLEALKQPNMPVSIGNRGVPTDRQTNQQTDRHIISPPLQPKISPPAPNFSTPPAQVNDKEKSRDHLDKAAEILASLDGLKKEIRLKVKRLTPQEMTVFSLLYQLEEQGHEVDYTLLSKHLTLSESSIRDYIGKIQRKGLPLDKEKLNNKRIILHISPSLKKIASLSTILQLREL